MDEPWHLPGIDAPREWWKGETASGQVFRAPVLSSEEAHSVAERVRAAALEARHTRSTTDVMQIVAAAAARLAGEGPDGETARRLLGTELGWDEELSRDTLAGMSRGWTVDAMHRLVQAELGGTAPLDGWVEDQEWMRPGRRLRRASGPPLILQVVAGNVPGVSVTATIRALLARSGVLCKVAEPEPGLLALFARLLAEEDPILGRVVATTWWPGHEFPDAWTEWADHCGKIVVYGGGEAVQAIRCRIPPRTDLVVYGPGIGIAVVLPGGDDGAAELARDVVAYDQQGCVSPRLVYVVGGSASSFAHRLAGALATETRLRPPPDPSPAEAVAIRALRAEAEFGGHEQDCAVVEMPGDDLAWTVLAREDADVRSEALPRVVRVHAVPDLSTLFEVLRSLAGSVQALGYAGTEELEALTDGAVRLGISRVSPVGTAAWPPPDWKHQGRHQLLPLLDWTDFETAD